MPTRRGKMRILEAALALCLFASVAVAQQQVPIVGGAVTIPAAPGNSYFSVVLNQNVTSFTITGSPPSVTVLFVQDSTGGRTVSGYASNISNTSAITIASAANATTAASFIYNSGANGWTASGGGGGGSSATLQTSGVNNASQVLLNFITSNTNAVGLTLTPSNPSGNDWKFEITGGNYSGNSATATALAAVPSQCTGSQFATGIAASGNANCSTPPTTSPGGAVGSVQYNNSGVFGGIDQNAFSSTRNVIQLSPNCVTGQTNCFQVKDDGFMATDCSVTSGSATVTCASSHFTAAMADGLHHIAVYKTCSTDAGLGNYVTELGAAGATISTFNSATSVTASVNATGTVTGTACIKVASIDDTPISNADAAAQASPTCPIIDLPAGIMGTKEPHFYTLTTSCAILGAVTGESAYAPTFIVRGQGGQVSQLWWTPDFDFAACTHGNGAHACMMINSTMFKDWGITGGGLPSFTGTVYLVSNDIAGHVTGYLDGFDCTNIGPNSSSVSNQIGLFIGNDVVYTNHASFDGCGASAAFNNGKLITYQSAFQDSGQAEIHSGTLNKLISLGGNFFYGASGMGSFKNLIEGGIVTTAEGDDFKTNGGPANLRCWQSTSTSGQSFYMKGAFCDAGQGIVVQNTGVTVTLRDSQITSSTPLIVSSGAPVVYDYGNNTLGGA